MYIRSSIVELQTKHKSDLGINIDTPRNKILARICTHAQTPTSPDCSPAAFRDKFTTRKFSTTAV